MMWFSDSQISSMPAIALIMAMYVVAILADKNANIKACLYAYLASILFSLSPIYNYLLENYDNSIIYSVYFSVYAIASTHFVISILVNRKENIGNYKPALACLIMALFELISYETFNNGLKYKGFESILYDYYEVIVTLLHVVVIATVVRWKDLRSFAGRFCDLVSEFFLGRYSTLLNGGKASYNKKRDNCQEGRL